MSSKFQAGILFDLDGVIIDSEAQYTEIWKEIDRRYPTGVENFPYVIKGTTLDDILRRHFPEDIRETVTRECYRMESEMVYGYRRGSEETLDKLMSLGVPMAMVTSSDAMKMEHLWRDIPSLRRYFKAIVHGSMVNKSKPHPEGYLMAAAMIGTLPNKCAVVEDSLQGVKAGCRAGSYVVGINGTLPGDVLREYSDEIHDYLDEIDIEQLLEMLKVR